MFCQAAGQNARYGAIAFSPSTGAYGFSHDWSSRAQAERDAVGHCAGPDARAVIWVKNGWAALARNEDGDWSTGWSGNSRAEAEQIALAKVYGGHILCWVYSGR